MKVFSKVCSPKFTQVFSIQKHNRFWLRMLNSEIRSIERLARELLSVIHNFPTIVDTKTYKNKFVRPIKRRQKSSSNGKWCKSYAQPFRNGRLIAIIFDESITSFV